MRDPYTIYMFVWSCSQAGSRHEHNVETTRMGSSIWGRLLLESQIRFVRSTKHSTRVSCYVLTRLNSTH